MEVIVALILVIVVPGLAIYLGIQLYQSRRSETKLKEDVLRLEGDLENLNEKVKPLWQYQPIEDVQAEVERIRSEAKEVLRKAKDRDQASEDKSIRIVRAAESEAEGIVAEARERAEDIAGEALEIKDKAEEFTQTVKAMKNIIDGYGDEYLVPNHSVIDDLAEEYDHKQAGQDLKQARAHSKSMIKQGSAAECDYAEAKRKRIAIDFVLDAFNGKVEAILSTVKHDNFGKLEQSIKDAFHLVNHNGVAFRNARITELYLAARLRELKWAVSVNELKIQEREEQRAIREQMREEEKARKEIEKAIREAEKEEKMLQKAMEKAKKELAAANDEERAKFEQQLAELAGKLDEAEAKNQRALSMAQQTRRGHVYVISNEGSFGEDVFKIGMTRRLEPMDRVKELGDASVPFPFDVHAIINCEDAPALENELHRRFDYARLNKVNLRKEYFGVTLAEIRQVVEERDFEIHWTMKAEAKEYRESKAMNNQAEKGQLELA